MNFEDILANLFLGIYLLPPCVFIMVGLGRRKIVNVLVSLGCMVIPTVLTLLLDYFPNISWLAYTAIVICSGTVILMSIGCVVYRWNNPEKKIVKQNASFLERVKRIVNESDLFVFLPLLCSFNVILRSILSFDRTFKEKENNLLFIALIVIAVTLSVIAILSKIKKGRLNALCVVVYLTLILFDFFAGYKGIYISNYGETERIFVSLGRNLFNCAVAGLYLLSVVKTKKKR